jgi:hypothetical protein
MKLKLLALLFVPSLAFGAKWECFNIENGGYAAPNSLCRLETNEGWIVVNTFKTMTFVSDTRHEWKI